MSQTSFSRHALPLSPIDPEGVVRCAKHSHLKAALRIAKTEANKNRQFYCCPMAMDDPDNCKFFKWADDPIFAHLRQPTYSQNASTTSTTISGSSQLQPSSQMSQPNSLKRMHSPEPVVSSNSQPIPGPSSQGAQNAGKAARLEAIQAALADQSPSAVHFPATSGSGFSQGSDVTLHESQPGSSSQRPVVPGSPSKRKRYDSGSTTATDAFVSLTSSPAQSLSDLESVPPAREPEQLLSQDTGMAAVPNLQTGSGDLTSGSIMAQIESLSTNVSAYIRKLENKIRALEQSNDAKTKRIKALEKDVLSQVSRNRELEDQNKVLERQLDALTG